MLRDHSLLLIVNVCNWLTKKHKQIAPRNRVSLIVKQKKNNNFLIIVTCIQKNIEAPTLLLFFNTSAAPS